VDSASAGPTQQTPYIPSDAKPGTPLHRREGEPVPLTKARLDELAISKGIVSDYRGDPGFNMVVGDSFEAFALRSVSQPKNEEKYFSPDTNRLVIPDAVSDITRYEYELTLFGIEPSAMQIFPSSHFWEVKAYSRDLSMSTQNRQLQALIDAASRSPAATVGLPPTVALMTTADVDIKDNLIEYADQKHVALWWSRAYEYPNASPVEDLQMGRLLPVNPWVYTSEFNLPPLSFETFERDTLIPTP
jgi:hypothetical protein